MADQATQVTQLYVQLESIDSSLSKLALKSEMNTIQTSLMSSFNTLTSQVSTLTEQVENLELTVSSLLSQLRSH